MNGKILESNLFSFYSPWEKKLRSKWNIDGYRNYIHITNNVVLIHRNDIITDHKLYHHNGVFAIHNNDESYENLP